MAYSFSSRTRFSPASASSLSAAALALLFSAAGCNEDARAPQTEQVARTTSALTVSDPATPLAVSLPQTADPLTTGLTIPADAPTKGAWSATQSWPLNGLHSVLLPNGRVLTYGTPSGAPATQDGRTFDIWDPSQGFATASHRTAFKADQVNSFCSAAAFLTNGRLMVSGGNSPLDSSEFFPADGTVATSGSRMADERWYGTMVTLADGRLLMVGGSTPYGALRAYQDPAAAANNGSVSMTPEIYETGVGWRSLFGANSRDAFGPDFHRYWYPRTWVAPDGRAFGISAEKMWYVNPAGNGSVTIAGNFKTGVSNTTLPNIGATSTAVMFAPGRILQAGGNGYHDGHDTPSSPRATIVDINGTTPVVTDTASMNIARQWPNSTVLPDGRVAITGGTRRSNNGGTDAVYEAELWNPATGTWTLGARAAQIRVYHSATILMPNGAVLSTGGGAPGPVNNLNAELYFPPYLFRASGSGAVLAPRPAVTAISSLQGAYGATLEVDVAAGTTVSKVVLIGASSVTHSFNSGQRRQELAFLQNGTRTAFDLPANANLAPPGYYLVFVIDSTGVPSRGVIIALGGAASPPVPTALLSRGSKYRFSSVSVPTHSVTTDAGNLGIIAALGANPAPADLARAQYIVRDGLADTGCVSLESTVTPGQWLRHEGYRLKLGASDGSDLFKNDATFCPEPGLGGSGITFRSKNFPTYVLRQRNSELWVDVVATDAAFGRDASFVANPVLDAPLVQRGTTLTFESVNTTGSVMATDAAKLGVLVALGANPAPADLARAQFIARDGLADASCISFESVGTPGQWLRHYGYRIRMDASDGSDLFKNDATFCPEVGLAGTGVSFRSKNFPTRVLRHAGPELWIDPVTTDAAFAGDASWIPRASSAPTPTIPSITAPPVVAGGTATYAPNVSAAGATYAWDFGDGATTPFASSPGTSHGYAQAGLYLVTFTMRLADGQTVVKTFAQAVYTAPVAGAPRVSSPVAYETRSSGSPRIWVVNPDNSSVAVIDSQTNARVAEITVGAAPRTVAVAPDGRIWVANQDSGTISIISPSTLAIVATVTMPRASRPYGLLFPGDGLIALLTLEGSGHLLKLNPSTGATTTTLAVGPNPRHVATNNGGSRAFVSRFISPPLTGEATATPSTTSGGAQVVVIERNNMVILQTIVLGHSNRPDGSVEGRGIPNYLGPALVSPDGRSAWVPSKQDNVARGTLRDGQNLDFQNTVRAVSSRINLDTMAEDAPGRLDHDNASVANAAVFHPTGAYLFVALETSRQVAVVNPVAKSELFRIEAGRAPQGLAISPDGRRLYIQNFMDRTVSVIDLTALVQNGEFTTSVVATVGTVATERLSAQVLLGKKLFYDARDTRLARDAYLSCATCHNDGGQDGRVWDLTGMGEGLRNTISLRGRAGGQSRLHWSGNFDEVQDFEGQIRNLAGGTGLMTDAAFNTGTRSQPLGDAKTGISADLDALAAYVKSLTAPTASPLRTTSNALTAAAVTGRTVFKNAGCTTCHNGSTYSDEGATGLRNIGTLKSSSGSRLGGALTGIDVPTLRDAWATAPYLHDGSAATLSAAIAAHNTVTLNATDLANVAAFVSQIDASEPGFAPPSGTTSCANENGTCTLPAGRVATVYYGANDKFFSRMSVTGSIACNNATFGDPIPGTGKRCVYR